MPLWSILLRVLLSVVLLFNGATTAVASVQMNHGSATAEIVVESEQVAPPVEEAPCHRHASTTDNEQPTAEPGTVPSEPEPTSSDCCKSGICGCVCVHHAQAAIVAVAFSAVVIKHADNVHAMSPGYVPPTLPHLIRPPIG